MKKYFSFFVLSFTIGFISCKHQNKEPETVNINPGSRQVAFEKKDTVKKEAELHDIITDNGENVLFFANGVVKMHGPMKDGKRNGHWQSQYPNGTLWSECDYTAGIKNGAIVTYYENGKKRYEGHYNMDKETGIWKFYQETGNLYKEVNYGNVK